MANIGRRSAGRSFGRRAGLRRESLWLGILEGSAALGAANSVAILNSLNAAALALTPFTVVRVRFNVALRSDQIAAAEDYQWAVGAAVVSS